MLLVTVFFSLKPDCRACCSRRMLRAQQDQPPRAGAGERCGRLSLQGDAGNRHSYRRGGTAGVKQK